MGRRCREDRQSWGVRLLVVAPQGRPCTGPSAAPTPTSQQLRAPVFNAQATEEILWQGGFVPRRSA